MSHTKGRLSEIGRESDGWAEPRAVILSTTAGQYEVLVLGHQSEANAARIVALWNAAEELGLTTEAIEAGAIQGAFAALRSVREACLFADDDGGVGITTDPHIHDELFERVCAPLRSLTKDTTP